MTEVSFEQRSIESARQQTQLQEPALNWLQPLREEGLAAFAKTGLPTRKTENWRYTSVYPLTQGDFLRLASATESDANLDIDGLDSFRLVFLNGRFDAGRSSAELPFTLIPFCQADSTQQALIQQRLGTVLNSAQHPFSLLNTGWMQDGALIQIGKNQRLPKPIQIVFEQTAAESECSVQPRLFIELESHAEAVVIEQQLGQPGADVFTNLVAEISLADGAKLGHYQLNLEPENVLHIGNVQVNLGAHADYTSYQFALSGKLKRRDLQVNLTQPGANATLYGIYLGRGSQQVDFHTVLEHIAAHCTSNEVVKGLVKDDAKAVFNGRIHIHRDAQQTAAEMSNKNLLLSKTAEVNTKPELEIYADDVKCAHGATVGQLDEDALFYFQSRGIGHQQAYEMLSNAFVDDVLNQMPDEAVRAYVSQFVSQFHQQQG